MSNNIFDSDNTEWVENDHGDKFLRYIGDLNDLSDETGLSKDELYDELRNYEQLSLDEIEYEADIKEAMKGEY